MAQQQRKAPAGQRSGMRTFYIILAVVVLAGIAWIAYSAAGGGGQAATEPVALQIDDPRALVQQAQGVTAGNADAPVQVFEFADYQCPACGLFNARIKPLVIQPLVESGQVQFVYYDFPLGGAHVHAFLAARAARCAGEQGRYWQYQDAVYRAQSSWSGKRSALDDFISIGTEVGLGAEFEECVRSDRFADVVTANRLLGDQLGVSATPTIFVNGMKVRDPLDADEVRQAIEQALGT